MPLIFQIEEWGRKDHFGEADSIKVKAKYLTFLEYLCIIIIDPKSLTNIQRRILEIGTTSKENARTVEERNFRSSTKIVYIKRI
jgi:hypothetical protein